MTIALEEQAKVDTRMLINQVKRYLPADLADDATLSDASKLAHAYAEIDKLSKRLKQFLDKARERLIEEAEAHPTRVDEKGHVYWETGGVTVKVQYSHRFVLIEEAAERILKEQGLYEKAVVPKISEKKLNDLVLSGELDTELVEQMYEPRDSKSLIVR